MKGFEEGLTLVSGMRNESIQLCHVASQALHLLDFLWGFHVEQGLDLRIIGFYSSVVDHEAEKLTRADSECTLGWVQLHFVFLKNFEGLPQVLDVLLGLETFHQHVVNIHLYSVADLLFKHLVHRPLVSYTCIL